MSGLPLPSRDYFPKVYRDSTDPTFPAITDKVDFIFEGLLEDQKNFRRILRIEQADIDIVKAYGYQVSADIQPGDSDRLARAKAYNAFQAANRRGTFEFDVKPKIDAIAGGNSSIVEQANESDDIILGAEATDPDNYWGTIGIDAIDDLLGSDIIGAYDELQIPGNVYIDVDNDSLTADQVAEIVASIESSCAAYFRVYLCYIDSGGALIVYTDGIIG